MNAAVAAHEAAKSTLSDAENRMDESKTSLRDAQAEQKANLKVLSQALDTAMDSKKLAETSLQQSSEELAATQSALQVATEKQNKMAVSVSEAVATENDLQGRKTGAAEDVEEKNSAYLQAKESAAVKAQDVKEAHEALNKLIQGLKTLQDHVESASQQLQQDKKDLESDKKNETSAERTVKKTTSKRTKLIESITETQAKIANSTAALVALNEQITGTAAENRTISLALAQRQQAAAAAVQVQLAATKQLSDEKEESSASQAALEASQQDLEKAQSQLTAAKQVLKQKKSQAEDAEHSLKRAHQDKITAQATVVKKTDTIRSLKVEIAAAQQRARDAERTRQLKSADQEMAASELQRLSSKLTTMKGPDSALAAATTKLAAKAKELAKAKSDLATASEILENGKRLFASALAAKRLAQQAAVDAQRKFQQLGLQIVRDKYEHKLLVVKAAKLQSRVTEYKQESIGWEPQVTQAEGVATASKRKADASAATASTEKDKSAAALQQVRSDEQVMSEHLQNIADARMEIEMQEKALAQAYEDERTAVRNSKLEGAKTSSGSLLKDARNEASRARKLAGLAAEHTLKAFKTLQQDKADKQDALKDGATGDLKSFASELSIFGEDSADSIKHRANTLAEASSSRTATVLKLINATAMDEIRDSKDTAQRFLNAQMSNAEAVGAKREAQVQVQCDDNAPCLLELAEQMSPAQAAAEVAAAQDAIVDAHKSEKQAAEQYKQSQQIFKAAGMKLGRQQAATAGATFEANHMRKAASKDQNTLSALQKEADDAAAKLKVAKDALDEAHANSDAAKKTMETHRSERKEAFTKISQQEGQAREAMKAAEKASGDIVKLEKAAADAEGAVAQPHKAVSEQTHKVSRANEAVEHIAAQKVAAKSGLDELTRLTDDATLKAKQATDKTNALDADKDDAVKMKADAIDSVANADTRAQQAHKSIISSNQQVLNAEGDLQAEEDTATSAKQQESQAHSSLKAQLAEYEVAKSQLKDANSQVDSTKNAVEQITHQLVQNERKGQQFLKKATRVKESKDKLQVTADGLNQELQQTTQKLQQDVDLHGTTVQQVSAAEAVVVGAQTEVTETEAAVDRGTGQKTQQGDVVKQAEKSDEAARNEERQAITSLNDSKDFHTTANNAVYKAAKKAEIAKKKLQAAEEGVGEAQESNGQAEGEVKEAQVKLTQEEAAVGHTQAALELKKQQTTQQITVLTNAVASVQVALDDAKQKESLARATSQRTTDAHEHARTLIEPAEDKTTAAKDRMDEANDKVVQTRLKTIQAETTAVESKAARDIAQQEETQAKHNQEDAVVAVSAAEKAVDAEEEIRKTNAAAAAKLLEQDTRAVESAQQVLDEANNKHSDAEGRLHESKMLVQSVTELGASMQREQDQITAASAAAVDEETGAIAGQSSIKASFEEVKDAHDSSVASHSQSGQIVQRLETAISSQHKSIEEAKSALEEKIAKHTETVAQIDAHNHKLDSVREDLKKASKALDLKKIEAEQVKAEEQSAKMAFDAAKGTEEQKLQAAAATTIEQKEKETQLSDEFTPAVEQATVRVAASAKAMEESQIQLTAMQKEVEAARNPGTVSSTIKDLVGKMKETMIPTSFSSLDVAPTLLRQSQRT